MGWADKHIEKLSKGQTVQFRPRGNSMSGQVESGQLVTIRPLHDWELRKDDIVLCTVRGAQYLHLVKAIQGDRVLIGNNKGRLNGWTTRDKVHGILISTED